MKNISAGLLCGLLLAGCVTGPDGSSMDRTEAQRVSDAFMAELVADHVDSAVDKMAPPFSDAAGRAKADQVVQEIFKYCGRPLEYELRHDEVGTFSFKFWKTVPMRAFFYSGKTTDNPKGACFYIVRVVPGTDGMKVVNFGPLKSVPGKEPAWAK